MKINQQIALQTFKHAKTDSITSQTAREHMFSRTPSTTKASKQADLYQILMKLSNVFPDPQNPKMKISELQFFKPTKFQCQKPNGLKVRSSDL